MTVASLATDGGAALRASAISAFRSAIRYWSSGAMLVGYGFLASCACICRDPARAQMMASMREALAVNVLPFIISSRNYLRTIKTQAPKCETSYPPITGHADIDVGQSPLTGLSKQVRCDEPRRIRVE